MPENRDVEVAPIEVYWRPGCGFCSSLLRGLEREGLAFQRVNIWDEPDGAEFVRSVANGSETVPTVRIGEVALVNPTPKDVLRNVAEHAPEHLPEGFDASVLEPSRPAAFVQRLFGGAS